MRIGLISHEYPPYVGGGIGTYVAAAANQLAKAGHEVHVFANSLTGAEVEPTESAGCIVHRLPLYESGYRRPADLLFHGRNPDRYSYASRETTAHVENLAAWTIAEAVQRVHQRTPLDVVESADCMAEAFYLIRRRQAGQRLPPIIVHMHGSTRESYRCADDPVTLGHLSVRARMRREDACIEGADAVLTPAQASMDRYAELYPERLPAQRDVIPYFYVAADPAPLPSGIGDWPYLLMLCRVEPRKGTDFALRAFAQIARDHQELRLVLCGAADRYRLDESVEELIASCVPEDLRDRVVLLGRRSRAESLTVLSHATLVVHPARWDNWPNTILEAMSVGACCVVSDAGGQAEMIQHKRCGLVTPLGDVPALAEAIQSLLRDEKLRRRFGEEARLRHARLTDTRQIAERKTAAYQRIIEQSPSREVTAELPGTTLFVIDAEQADPYQVSATLETVSAYISAGEGHRGVVLGAESVPLPSGWTHHPLGDVATPWAKTNAKGFVVWLRAGAVLDDNAVPELLRLIDAASPAAAFPWMERDNETSRFPFRCDLGFRDLLLGGSELPSVFATRVRNLATADRLNALITPASRTAALLAVAAIQSGELVRHTARISGRDQQPPLRADRNCQRRALGYLELRGLAPHNLMVIGRDPDATNGDGLGPPETAPRRTPRRSTELATDRPAEPTSNRSPMRICIASHEYPPYPGGGIATYCSNAARAFAQSGHETHVVTNDETFGSDLPEHKLARHQNGLLTVHRIPLLDAEYRPLPGAEIFGLPRERLGSRSGSWAEDISTLNAWHLADAVMDLHREHHFDIIEVPDMFAEAFFMARRRLAGGRDRWPAICVVGHTSSRETFRVAEDAWQLGSAPQRQRMRCEDASIEEADALITPSESLMRRYEQWFGERLPRTRQVVANFFMPPPAADDPTSSGAALTKQALPAVRYSDLTLVAVGRFEPRKGSDILLRAFARLAEQYPSLELVFVGQTGHWRPGESFEQVLSAAIPERYRDRVRFTGLISPTEVLETLSAATVFVHPARWDNWPNVVLEAMSVAACCVVSDHGGHSEMIEHGESGLLFTAGDDRALAGTLDEVLGDPARRALLGQAARRRYTKLTDTDQLLRAKLNTYRSALEHTRDPVASRPGLIIVDAGGTDAQTVARTIAALDSLWLDAAEKHLFGCSPDDIPAAGWRHWTSAATPPWLDLAPDAVVVWVSAGALPDEAGLRSVTTMASDRDYRQPAMLWLESEHEARCMPSDLSSDDLLVALPVVPPVLATAAAHLTQCRSLAGARSGPARLATLIAAASLSSGETVRHCGEIGGLDLGEPLVVDHLDRTAILGRLEIEGLLEQSFVDPGQ